MNPTSRGHFTKVFKVALHMSQFEVDSLNVPVAQEPMYSEIMKRLIAMNILSDVGGGKYTLHSTIMKHYLEEKMKEIEDKKHRWW